MNEAPAVPRGERPLLVIEPDREKREYLRQVLQIEGFQTVGVETLDGGLDQDFSRYALLLVSMSGQTAPAIAELHERAPNTEIIAIAERGALDLALKAVREGAADFVVRPFDPAELVQRATRVLERRLREQELARLRGQMVDAGNFHGIIGRTSAMRKVFTLIDSIAPTDATVLVNGETGTGKELVARALHDLSPRRDKPFVSVNCAAIPETLLESELFGHEKGAFTGAIRRKTGRFEEAHTGTIFLDEIGELPLSMQSKLLRVLQERQVRRVGGTQAIDIDIRIVLATNRDLEKMVKDGRFREDLYYRVHVVPVTLPSLRERIDDLPLLVEHFVGKYRGKANSSAQGFSKNALARMSRYPWPGNVRELENFIERALILSRDRIIDDVDLPEAAAPNTLVSNNAAPLPVPTVVDTAIPLKDLIDQLTARLEAEYITHLLREYRGNIKKSYSHAGISRRGFFEKMRQYNIRKEDFK
ncbi:MAG TPA: sigma-54 dependent transcriptional regulator [bacterium]|nr:sigma-54 dependent transcriptional regulator [bacterium]